MYKGRPYPWSPMQIADGKVWSIGDDCDHPVNGFDIGDEIILPDNLKANGGYV